MCFTPQVSTPRLRKGNLVSVGDWFVWVEELRKGRRVLGDYYQVSLRDKPFGDELGIPAGTLMPFALPKGFADDEVVESCMRWLPAFPVLNF